MIRFVSLTKSRVLRVYTNDGLEAVEIMFGYNLEQWADQME
jgi:hypothetical protein